MDQNNLIPLTGFDPAGEVFIYNGRVLRGIFNGFEEKVIEVLERVRYSGILGAEIVQTSVFNEPLPDLNYPLILEHEKIPFISYAHEWTPSMLKDAALSQIKLMKTLLKNGLILKDCGMTTNILFKGPKPMHVDFLSVIFKRDLTKEGWLEPRPFISPFQALWSEYSDCFNQIFRAMFFPCMLYPLYLILFKGYHYAARRIFDTHMNTSNDTISEAEAFVDVNNPIAADYFRSLAAMEFALVHERDIDCINILEDMVKGLNVAVKTSPYVSYYDEKKENFDHLSKDTWKDKQLIIDEVLDSIRPSTVLDIGANTGWFSILAAQKGAYVISIDNDVACMEVLYEKVKDRGLAITPLVIDFVNPLPDIYCNERLKNEPHMKQSRFLHNTMPLILNPERRLKCDMVIALAVIHHFVLGSGIELRDCIKRLVAYCNNTLILEFVDKNDPLIEADPPFFNAYYKHPEKFEFYHINECLKILTGIFKSVVTRPLTGTRNLIICTTKIS